MKYAIYSTDFGGLYAMEYIDNLKDCENLMGGWLVKENDLPIIVNRVGGRTSFDAEAENFVKIIECSEDDVPLTREQMYPKNSDKFEYGWIDTEGNTYACAHEGHWESSEAICKELGIKTYNCEAALEERGWAKVTGSWERGTVTKTVFVKDFFLTKKQADTLYDKGLWEARHVQGLIKCSEDRW